MEFSGQTAKRRATSGSSRPSLPTSSTRKIWGGSRSRLPWLGGDGDAVRAWATLLTPYADDDQGFEFLPAVDTQVVIAFEAGDLRRPYIVGSCWNGREALPEAPDTPNNKRLIKTRSGSLLEFDDTEGAAKVTVSHEAAATKLVLDDAAQEVKLQHSNGCVIKIDCRRRHHDHGARWSHDQRARRPDCQCSIINLFRLGDVSTVDGDRNHFAHLFARRGQHLVSYE